MFCSIHLSLLKIHAQLIWAFKFGLVIDFKASTVVGILKFITWPFDMVYWSDLENSLIYMFFLFWYLDLQRLQISCSYLLSMKTIL